LTTSGFFRDLFSLPQVIEVNDTGAPVPPDPLDIVVSKQSINLLRSAMINPPKPSKHVRFERLVSNHIHQLSLHDQAILHEVADRFDCERICGEIMVIINNSADDSPTDLLTRSSKANVVWVAKLAIAKFDCEPGWDDFLSHKKLTVDDWWEAIGELRPSWQLALTKLQWEGSMQLVERPKEVKRRRPNGKAYPRRRERIMIETKLSWVEIADRFDPEEYGE
jgi:hypothetical protein